MRVLTCLTAALLGTAVMLAQPIAASAQGSVQRSVQGAAQGDQSWQACISVTTPPDDKVVAWFPIAGSLQVEPCNGGRSSYVFRMTYAADAAGSGFDNGKL
jgi:hypothetical protein